MSHDCRDAGCLRLFTKQHQGSMVHGDIKKDKLGPVAPRGVDPRSSNFQGM